MTYYSPVVIIKLTSLLVYIRADLSLLKGQFLQKLKCINYSITYVIPNP